MSKLSSVRCVRIKHQTYILKVQCGDEPSSFFVGRTAAQISEFRSKLLEEFKSSKEVSVPDFKAGVKWYESNKDDKKKKAVDEFCQQILQLPTNVTETETVTQFFTSSAADSEEQVCKSSRHNSAKVSPSQKDSQGTQSSPTTPLSPATPVTPGLPITPVTPVTPATEQQNQSPVDGSFGQYEDISGFTGASITTNNTAANNNVVIDAVYAEVYKENNSVRPVTQPSLPVRNVTDSEVADGLQYGGEYAEIPATSTAIQPASTVVDSVDTQHTATTTNNNTETPASLPNKNPGVTLPVTHIPPIPQMTPPTLSSPKELPEDYESFGDQNEIQVIAVADYTSSTDNILSFTKGDLATLIVQSDTKWWCIKLGNTYGWVPADYWRMLNPDAECVSLNVNSKTSAPWFVGKLSRAECEELLMLHGKQQHFVVRESTNLVGHYALSVKYNERVHHFPIELTADERYYIGKHHFKTVNNVITYYKKNALFYNESGEGVTLGNPLVIIKH